MNPLKNIFNKLYDYFEKICKFDKNHLECYLYNANNYLFSIIIPYGTLRLYKIITKFDESENMLKITIQKIMQGKYSSITYEISDIYQHELERALFEIANLIGEYLVVFNQINAVNIFDVEFRKTVNGKIIPILCMSFYLGDHTLFIHIAALSPHRDVIVPLPPSRTIRPLPIHISRT